MSMQTGITNVISEYNLVSFEVMGKKYEGTFEKAIEVIESFSSNDKASLLFKNVFMTHSTVSIKDNEKLRHEHTLIRVDGDLNSEKFLKMLQVKPLTSVDEWSIYMNQQISN